MIGSRQQSIYQIGKGFSRCAPQTSTERNIRAIRQRKE
jgi:hypothetical protein